MLQKARDRIISRKPLPFAPSIKCYSVSIRDLITVQEIDSVLELLEYNHGPEQPPIAISLVDTPYIDEIPMDLSAAIIMYNFGVAHAAYSKALQKQQNLPHVPNSDINRRAAVRLLELSDTVLESLAFGEDGASDTRRNILVVRIFILLGLYHQTTGNSDAKRVQEEISSVYYEISLFCHQREEPQGRYTRNAAA
jgi:hypothetical protein